MKEEIIENKSEGNKWKIFLKEKEEKNVHFNTVNINYTMYIN